jgi:outer membrane lipoprotein-sorting protein
VKYLQLVFIYLIFTFLCVAEDNKVVQYLASIRTLNGNFIQYNPDRTESSGSLWISVPGKLRLEYDRPPIALVINKNLLTYHDKKLDETSHIFIDKDDPIFSLLKNPGSISESEITYNKDYIYISRSNNEKKSTIKLTKEPISIISLSVDNYNSGITQLKFHNLSYNKPINKKIFTGL